MVERKLPCRGARQRPRGQAQVREDPHNHHGLFDRGDDLRLTAARAPLDVDVEHALEQPCPPPSRQGQTSNKPKPERPLTSQPGSVSNAAATGLRRRNVADLVMVASGPRAQYGVDLRGSSQGWERYPYLTQRDRDGRTDPTSRQAPGTSLHVSRATDQSGQHQGVAGCTETRRHQAVPLARPASHVGQLA